MKRTLLVIAGVILRVLGSAAAGCGHRLLDGAEWCEQRAAQLGAEIRRKTAPANDR